MVYRNFVLTILLFLSTAPTSAQELPLSEHLAVFAPMLGKTFEGMFAGSTAENPQKDVSKWERAMNGQAVRILHSVNDGAYGGESIFMWDPKEEKIKFWYFTTAGFYTTGTLEIEGQTWSSIEKVTGNTNGITEVRSTATIMSDGTMVSKAEFFKDGEWTPGHEITYRESPTAKVIFK
ncbi:MAG TPA: hypothetical protein PKD64_07995 [Pirellulaceae bacterium]|nr:hypothetical protein [Pirellulaceae bacterium]HMO92129.1 hypothetical protein [Pirellulaceae bacterium]HMP69283.1 hypothetical protein [Pirellulaceae bacterium]